MIEPCLSYKILMALSDLGMVLPDFDEAQETIEKILSEYSCEKNPTASANNLAKEDGERNNETSE